MKTVICTFLVVKTAKIILVCTAVSIARFWHKSSCQVLAIAVPKESLSQQEA